MDFAENYTYLLQIAAQGYHRTKDQCTLHLVVIYGMINGKKKHFSLCYISEDLNHDVPFVQSMPPIL
jgi:hypothetical protein